MRKRKPKVRTIGKKGANKLMHDLGLRTPEDIERRYQEIIRRNPAARKLGEEMERHINLVVDHMFRPVNFPRLVEQMSPEIFAALSEKIGDCETIEELATKLGGTMPDIPRIDFELIEGTGNRCGCCHQPIKAREGIAFGRPGLLGGKVPPINVCAECVRLAQIHLESAKEGLI